MSVGYEDTSDMRAIARHIRAHADTLRDRAATLCARSDATHWYSPAADSFRDEVRDIARHLHLAAERLDRAAHTLDRHADRVHSILSVPSRVVHAGAQLVGL
ncbi:MAG: hypothetical protein QOG80_1660 [Pseudonocardiales bacterium]|jgi:hypothetical protein|nr:hypothetical protein [Pseudonocardiales bacterium]